MTDSLETSLAVQEKRVLRSEVRRSRRRRTPSERNAAEVGLTKQLIQLTLQQSPALLTCYLSLPDEPNTRPFLAWAAEAGVEVLVPTSRADGRLDWIRNGLPHDLAESPGLFGISERVGEPVDSAVVDQVDLMLIPAAAIDRLGMRLGWGRGYFDRALSEMAGNPAVMAVVFDEEIVDEVPSEPHDRPVHGVVSPGVVRFF